ncbi:UDP-N-acetylmuramoyl-L-alanyl-D-glutamate--2,6-diaminopimelate ligase [Deferribacterales bacterium Es71-Z0220]|jgi:UDP-N-acetylmuramoyl-L-alanyl-D-glutamate--2,6-diaminopimelate ligase|uniref:UDP-N-acetylmuramoyl-L-alanyl-D-glutamate--2, 6-diaminopimelate ligase n=1 Tax=Deferrivibrio essentukiensis TaxID=2880922 RepID=UPI001F605D92|nr:UDP-N-acetylmuramoyl-L-alanyl-D-glutamate--2,6-diaminopimelate ligase [Deferrivibrio essentukiensis]MBZ4672650.1 UDP-N-acetylmuramyl-tripeptide synthetase [Deferribacteraceae bacterium]MCB4205276.1 UDP-N-acetylmuramoyl-L-alanyl-D-glutamate--2,6-diaminopimelate ligase [Deferrivibrio essentukiensis]
MKIEKLLKDIKVLEISDSALLEKEVEDISFDNRDIKPNSIFVAIKGEAFDTHSVINDVYSSGEVVCVLTEKKVDNIPYILVDDSKKAFNNICLNYFNIDLNKFVKIGITGTNGKTTTSYLVESILKSNGAKTIRLGTVEYDICGEKLTANNTTPGMYEICSMIAKGVKKGADALVMEISSHALKQNRIFGLKFDVAVFTNLSGDHLDYHLSMDDYYNSKKLLFTDLYSDKCVINIEGEYGYKLYNEINIKKLSCAVSKDANLVPRDVDYHLDGINCKLKSGSFDLDITSCLVGQHNLENILCAVGAGYMLNINGDAIRKGIESLKNVPGRLEKIESNGIYYFVDYAHTDDALLNVLRALSFYKKNRIITVFGCGGDRDKTKRPRMAKAAEQYSDKIIVTSDNPRTEDPEEIIEDILQGFEDKKNVVVIPDRRKAIQYTTSIAEEGDIVLVAGKGHEDYQIIGKEKIHFDDKEEILKAITEK